MTDDKLELDIQSLGHLTATLRAMKDLLTINETAPPSRPGTAEAPSAIATRGLIDERIPSLNNALHARLDEVAALLDKVRNEFKIADETHSERGGNRH